MGRNVFVSFRFSDGNEYKKIICEALEKNKNTVDFSEDKDRSGMQDSTIQEYLYRKLKEVSVVIILVTPNSLIYKTNWLGQYDDWCYDEVRYALENRFDNTTKGLVAVYVPEVENQLITKSIHKCSVCGKESTVSLIKDYENLFRKNMMNIKPEYKTNKCDDIYDSLLDSYCSLVSLDDFLSNIDNYIENAVEKKENKHMFNLHKRL